MNNVAQNTDLRDCVAQRGARRHLAGLSSESTLLYNSQTGAVVLCCGIVFKVSSLPGLVSLSLQSSTLWLYIVMSAVDLVCLAATVFFAYSGADVLLSRSSGFVYRAFNALTCAYFTVKGYVYFVYAVIFLTVDLFVGIAPYIVVLVLAVPVIYLGVKGLRTVARCCEIFALLLLGIIVVNLCFLKTDADFGRNLPVFSVAPGEFLERGLRFGMWLGDLFPLMFAGIRRKKLPWIGISAGVSYSLVVIVAALAVAMYGNALPYVYNMLIRIAGFNRLSMEIGRLEWAALFVVIVMAVLGLALLFHGASESSFRAFGSALPARLLFSAAITVGVLVVPTPQDVVEFSKSDFGYVMFALAAAIAVYLFAAGTYARKKGRRSAEEERPFPEEPAENDVTSSVESEAACSSLPQEKEISADGTSSKGGCV